MVEGKQKMLLKVFQRIFKQADATKSGVLTSVQLTNVLSKRARGTALDGNSVAMFTLCEQIKNEDANNQLTQAAFEAGLKKAIVNRPTGAVAQWISREITDSKPTASKRVQRALRKSSKMTAATMSRTEANAHELVPPHDDSIAC